MVIPFIYFMISKLIVIVDCGSCGNSQNPIYDLKSYLFKIVHNPRSLEEVIHRLI